MRLYRKMILAALTAALAITALSGAALARTGIAVEEQEILAIADDLVFAGAGGGTEVTCEVTLHGTLHGGVIPKTVGALLGFVTEGDISPACPTSVPSTVDVLLLGLPWHITYLGFTGELPEDIDTVELLLDRFALLLEIATIFFGDIDCLYSDNVGTISNGGVGGTGGPGISSLVLDSAQAIPLAAQLRGITECPEPIHFAEDPFVFHDPITIELVD